MPAPAMSSRHLSGTVGVQAAPRLRTHRSGPLSRDHPQIPVSMPSLFRFDASAVVHTCSSSHRTPAPLTARRHPQRSPPRLLTDAACGGLESPPARRPGGPTPITGTARIVPTIFYIIIITSFRTHVGARNRVVAGQTACLYSLMRPSQRVVRTGRRGDGWSVVLLSGVVCRGGRWCSERWGR